MLSGNVFPSAHESLRWIVTGIAVLVLLTSCGDKAVKAPTSIESGIEGLYRYAGMRLEEHVKELAALVRKDPERGIPLLMSRLKQERTDPNAEVVEFYLDPSEKLDPQTASVKLNQAQRVMASRLACFGYPAASFSVSRGIIEMRLPRGSMEGEELDGFLATLIARMSMQGRVSLRLEQVAPGTSVAAPKAHRVVSATWRPGLETYLPALHDDDSGKRAKDEAEDENNEPKKNADSSPSSGNAEHASYYEPTTDVPEFLERDGLNIRTRADRATRNNVIEVRPAAPLREAFAAWLETYRGYSVLLLVEGAAEARATITEHPESMISFSLPQTQDATEFIRRQLLACNVTCGALPIKVLGREIRHRPGVPNPPIAMVLAEVGPAADAALLKFQPDAGDLGHVVKWIRDEITRRATGITDN